MVSIPFTLTALLLVVSAGAAPTPTLRQPVGGPLAVARAPVAAEPNPASQLREVSAPPDLLERHKGKQGDSVRKARNGVVMDEEQHMVKVPTKCGHGRAECTRLEDQPVQGFSWWLGYGTPWGK
ncbi:hypothetical protein OC861_003780 [Tilletia horrida]|nr:hypothetical protein OC861_003780 [Tilletia horrida]